MRWGHRIRQFIGRLATTRPPDDAPAQALLSDAALELLRRMSPGDQRHALCVLVALRQDGVWDSAVEQAALLHDVGKSQARLTLLHRVAVVLLQAAAPRWLARLAVAQADAWRHPFYVQLHHAEIGAMLCDQAGCAPATVALVRAHQSKDTCALPPELHAAWAALRRADERC